MNQNTDNHAMLFITIRTWRTVKLAFYVTKRITTVLIVFINITIKKVVISNPLLQVYMLILLIHFIPKKRMISKYLSILSTRINSWVTKPNCSPNSKRSLLFRLCDNCLLLHLDSHRFVWSITC